MSLPMYFEDFEVGHEVTTHSRTITETDIVLFAGLTGDLSRIHMDDVYARGLAFSGRVAHGVLGLSLALGFLAQLRLTEGSAIALLGISDWRFMAPVVVGDTLYAQVLVEEVTPTSSSDRGVVVRRIRLLNHKNEIVQEGQIASLISNRGPVGRG